jgi:hypothetical protein
VILYLYQNPPGLPRGFLVILLIPVSPFFPDPIHSFGETALFFKGFRLRRDLPFKKIAAQVQQGKRGIGRQGAI